MRGNFCTRGIKSPVTSAHRINHWMMFLRNSFTLSINVYITRAHKLFSLLGVQEMIIIDMEDGCRKQTRPVKEVSGTICTPASD